MLTFELATALRRTGLGWTPAPGDRFVITTDGLHEDIYHVSEMTVEVHEFVDGVVIGFNGTTEWALDSIDLGDVLWFPREDQLRAALGPAFVRLETVQDGYVVTVASGGRELRALDIDAERAYARALVRVLADATPPPSSTSRTD